MRSRFGLFTCLALAALCVSACTPTQATRGNIVESFRMEKVTIGESSRTDVLRHLGSPTTQAPFDENVWYYIGQKTEKRGIFDPEVVDERIVVVAFNDEGLVDVIEEIDNERVDLPMVRRKTPTGGHEVTFLQQLLGNVGRFNRPTTGDSGGIGAP